jgi:hypothetical protein
MILFSYIKKISFSGSAGKEDWKKAALECFEKNKFKIIKKEFLTKDLFKFRGGHEKGDFIGKLFQIICKESGLKCSSYQNTYNDMSKNHKLYEDNL